MLLLLTGAGEASAQNSPGASAVPAVLAQPRPAPVAEPPIVRMRTAGQPDRQLKVLRVTAYTEGESVAEVQDVQTGQTFTLPGKVVAMLPKEAANAAPAPIPPMRPAPSAVPPPGAKSLPKPDEQPAPKVTFIPPPAPDPVAEPKSLPIAEPKPAVAPAAEPPARAPGASLVWRPRGTEAPALKPAPLDAAKPDRWTPMRRFDAVPPQSLAPSLRTIARGAAETGREIEEGPPAVRLIRPSIVEERSELVPVAYRTVEVQIREEVQGYVYDLGSALRPSVRENAAICLAEGRYGSRREVKTVLAKAAIADPAPSVRAACIELLLKLGYHDPEYMAYLQSASVPGAGPTLVRAAAKDALAKLAPRGY